MALRAMSSCFLNTSRDVFITSLGSSFQCSITLSVKKCLLMSNLNLPLCSLRLCPLVLSQLAWQTRPHLSLTVKVCQGPTPHKAATLKIALNKVQHQPVCLLGNPECRPSLLRQAAEARPVGQRPSPGRVPLRDGHVLLPRGSARAPPLPALVRASAPRAAAVVRPGGGGEAELISTMLRGVAHGAKDTFTLLLTRPQSCNPGLKFSSVWPDVANRSFLIHSSYTTDTKSREENKKTLENLYSLSVDITKIRRLKEWVLLQDVAYVKEIAGILQEMGADETTVANIIERCPEAILHTPAEINSQRALWQLVCQNEKQLVKLIEQFPESFFTTEYQQNQKANILFFQELGLKNNIITRFLTSAPNIFYNPVEKNKNVIETLQRNYLNLGGSEANMKIWILKLLSQNPFILLNTSTAIQENLEFLQKNDFTDQEVLQLLSKLKGFIFQLNSTTMQKSMLFSKNIFKCSDQELKQLVLKCPALLYYSVPVLEERLEGLLKEGISIAQIRETPVVLELTTQIVQYRIKKLSALGYDIKGGNLESLNGTKKDFEVTYGKIQSKKERPIFNPVAPLHIED
ncbi:transcription termination factor 2, mitochondrial [Vidua chalybeata]|uniref:transcription termination factor 2, mitochondrial n=1 Tax=Vidua chalybeata TaxID=81927 RepID=UPI0023A802E2|nr:transcription termination factor 2, mitochondrial [Vidua chalybeata]